MPDYLAELRASVEARMREQIDRHLRVNAHVNLARVIEIQMQQERERLERLIDESDEDPHRAEALLALLSWLPDFERQLKKRSS